MSKAVTPKIVRQGEQGPEMKWVEKVSHLLDSRYEIPGTRIRFGLDPVLSLIPVVGDFITYAISGVLIYTMYQHGASRKVVIKMILNSSLDALIGSIPLVGTVFDVFYKSNERNMRLLREHYYEGKHVGSGSGILWAVGISVFLVMTALLVGIGLLISYLLEWIGS